MPLVLKHNILFKALKAFVGVLLLVCIGGLTFLFFHHRASLHVMKQEDISRNRSLSLSQRFEIQGVNYNSYFDGNKATSIKADRLLIEKKKLGFFRFGLMNVARIENALIRIYGREELSGNNADDSYDNLKKNLSFKETFSKETLPSFPIKRISSIVIEPVIIELRDEQSVITRISAASAVINVTKRSILFEGNVSMVSGDRSLKADRLSLFPEKAIIKTGSRFLIKTPQKEWEGHRLTMDIFLRPINS